MYLAAKEFPLPVEYRFLPLEEVFHEPPADVVDRVHRLPRLRQHRPHARVASCATRARASVNIDHHHDNTRFGDDQPGRHRRLLDGRDRLRAGEEARGRDHARDRQRALRRPRHRHRPLHRTRTPTRRTHRMAAELIEAGVDVSDTYRRLYERVPIEKVQLVAQGARARSSATRTARWRSPTSRPRTTRTTGASPRLTEGIIDHVRAIEGTKVAAVVRDQARRRSAARKVSLRSTDGDIDVSAIAREHGEGATAARRGSPPTSPTRRSSTSLRASPRAPDDRGDARRPARRQARRGDLPRRRRRGPARARRQGRATRAPSTRSRRGC